VREEKDDRNYLIELLTGMKNSNSPNIQTGGYQLN
jgi:hypothetical protein